MKVSDIVKVKKDGSLAVITDIDGSTVYARKLPGTSGSGPAVQEYRKSELAAAKAEYRIPVTWEMAGFVKVVASSAEEAVGIFEKDSDHIPLPEGEYVEGSFVLSGYEDELHLYQ